MAAAPANKVEVRLSAEGRAAPGRLADKNERKPWLKRQWVIPPRANAAFAAAVGDALDVYARTHDASRPVVGVDEGGKRLAGDAREPPPVRPGSAAKQGYEYESPHRPEVRPSAGPTRRCRGPGRCRCG